MFPVQFLLSPDLVRGTDRVPRGDRDCGSRQEPLVKNRGREAHEIEFAQDCDGGSASSDETLNHPRVL